MDTANNETHERLLDIAAALFATKGYDSVRLRDITVQLGIKHSALYYYAPEGKEQLYMQVMRRSLQRHQAGMTAAIASAGPHLRDQMRAVANWLLAHPPLNVGRMETSDLAALSPQNARALSDLMFEALRQPMEAAIAAAAQAGAVTVPDAGLAAITFVALVELLHSFHDPVFTEHKSAIIDSTIEMLLNGWLKR